MSNQKTKTGGMPDWLKTALETKTGGFRKARWQRCTNCGELTIHGMDADICAGMVTVDPTPLTRQQEIWCAIHGRRTYRLTIDPDRSITIWDRPRYSLGKESDRPVVPEHECGMRYGVWLELPDKAGHTKTVNEPPPF
ncbi:hypothetical protein QEH44_gp61 [Arthrobacter phage Shambre1]|uniref:Uncharacterized protein n=1 Tax=Arthrobacter phage Shambre1 TaxID=2927284 RepID=A0A977PR41_9CAUD|nr:hypothetical protein QEH44_gp61 [Arthrobacter phage Shambre1]UXE04797.1 hypothetical protein SEA_SHAMBRE1_61 [Arthrobacter phage Shambre1]